MSDVLRRDGIYLPRLWWWYPWHVTRWWLPRIWRGGDEWCNVPLCINIPLLGTLVIYQFWRPMRTMPCAECWAEYDDVLRSEYLSGGVYEGGKVHSDRFTEWAARDPAG